LIGKTIGNYRIDEKLGEGGVGLVWRATDLVLDRPVALKVLRAEFAARDGVVERFRSEAVTLARLNHPNVATLYSFVCEGDLLMMVMEYVQGQTFEHLVHAFGPMRFQRALPLFFQALDGIEYAHDHGIVHRDIKASNVMLNHLGVVKVMDFGIARVLGSVHLTQHEHRVGTPAFMAPEQIRGEEADVRSDVYSLGLLLYLLLTGKAPFSAKSDYELCRMHLEEAPPSPRAVAGDIPDAVERAVLRTLAKAPAERFETVRELRAALSTGFVATLTTPMGVVAVGSKKTLVLPEDDPLLAPREMAKTVEFPEEELLQETIGATSADDEKTAHMEALPAPASEVVPPERGRRRVVAGLLAGATLAAVAALWGGRLQSPDTPSKTAPPQASPASPAVAPSEVTPAAPPLPTTSTQASELPRKAQSETPAPPTARKTLKTHKRALVKRAVPPSPPAPETEALPAARDGGQEDGWVIRRR
jgi:serine/threonine-protein kinase